MERSESVAEEQTGDAGNASDARPAIPDLSLEDLAKLAERNGGWLIPDGR